MNQAPKLDKNNDLQIDSDEEKNLEDFAGFTGKESKIEISQIMK